ncbi:MAG: isopeptide-forming domain-containing fimbrial protein [Desulfobacteraceae bacterium]|nr:isopeptide-forming domain-containing fimbrial protein [Desulfobacteraceae bacterium]
MEKFFFFNKIELIAAGCCLPVFFLRCWSHVTPPKRTRSKLWTAWIGVAVALPLLGKLLGMCSNRKIWNWKSFRIALKTSSANLGIPLLILFALLLGVASTAQADQFNCSDAPYNGVVDGDLYPAPDNIKLDMNCTIKNYPGGMSTNFSFDNNDPTPYLIIFDNVLHTGQMSCNTVAGHTIWFVNGSSTSIQEGCQNLLIPVEKIDKQSPAPIAAIGIPFTYTLTIPVLYDAGTGTVINSSGSLNDLHSIKVTDDLNATGASLTYVNHVAYWQDSLAPVPHTFSNVGGVLNFNIDTNTIIPAEEQIIVEITVVLNDTPANVPGTVFTNTAKWSFGRLIDGVYYEPLPGEWGISDPMAIVGPDLVVTKSSTATALNIGDAATFTIDVQNDGGGDAWNTTILDNIPVGMCAYDPTSGPGVSAQIFEADGVTPVTAPLVQGIDYTATYSGAPLCQLSMTMLDAAAAKIGPSQHLIITYQSQLDSGFSNDGATLTNVAGATQWFSAESSYSDRRQYGPFTLTDGTPLVLDFQDSETITAALSGYYFEKTVENLNTGMYPATTAAPGDSLHYNVRLFNVDQTINGITISDELDVVNTFGGMPTNVTISSGTYSFDPTGGTSGTGLLEVTGVDVAPGGELVIEFDITLRSTLTNGTVVSNQASLDADQGTPDPTDDFFVTSDDPYTNGVSSPDDPNDQDPTEVEIRTPGPLSKANTRENATIGEQFTYRITVPATPIDVPLYDVQILDDLSLSNANLSFVSATVISGGAWALSNTGSATNLIIEDTATGIDIPANGQAVIDITVALQNTITNQSGLAFANSASYTYNRMNGNNATQTAGGGSNTSNMNVVEPDLTATKAVSFVTPAGKLPTDPATVGDVLEYLITIPNGGNSTAFDTSIVDTLPANVSLVPDSATAQINGVAVTGFVVTPTTLSGGELAWGQQNGDFTLDIPVGQTLVMSYQVTVESVTGADINNSVYVDWTSLDGGSLAERSGVGCPTTDTLNDYCYGPVTVSVAMLDNTSIAKSAVGDSYAEIPPSTTDSIVRVGDTVTYDLTLNLQEYTTRNVVVEDDLPVGLALESFTITGGANFSYTLAAQPAVGDTGTLRWEFGDITNTPSNDGTPIDTLVIEYVSRVVIDAPPVGVDYGTSILRNNLARLSYTGGDPAVYPDRLTATETIEVRQPQMRATSKIDLGTGRVGTGTVADPYQVNISTDVMNFQLSSCNDGLAPAYGVVITDQLAPELDESDLVANPPVVKIGTTTLTAGPDYTYTAPPRGGQLRIALLDSAPVNPGECITVDYDIGFHTDLTVSRTWSNQARLPEYRSLPLSQPGRIYTSTNSAEVWMTNLVNEEQLLKTLISPAEATIGDNVVYQITVPAAPINSALDNVVVTDSLDGVLEYVSATAVDGNGASVNLTDNSVAPGGVNLGIGSIPAGEQVIITLTARVANNDQANAGVSFTNTARYTATNILGGLDTSSTSGPVTIVEPLLAIAKTVANVSNPGAAPNVGDILRYSMSFTASGGAAGDNFSDAFDLLIEDSLSLGLAYQSGTASVDGMGNTIVDPTVTGDGSTTAQTLTWSPADVTADIDVVEGTQVTLTYDVVVLNGVLAGQELSNSATAQWTGLDGENAFERNGTGTPVENDYFTGPASVTIMTELAVSMVKSVVNVTTGQDPGTNAEPGDTLRYTIVLTNQSIVPLNNASVLDELDAHFAPGSLQLISVSDTNADTTNTDATGGANGTGIVDIRNLTLAVNDSVTIVFEARLAPSIPSGTTVLNQALLTVGNLTSEPSNQTSTLISSSPAFEVWKTSQDITGDPAELIAGDSLRYTITIKNIGNEDAVNVRLRDLTPANTTYAANSTTLNGSAVADPSPGVNPLIAGILINAPENTAVGFMRADTDSAASNAATITFDVVVNASAVDGTIISNQGFVSGNGAGGAIFPQQPSDDPDTAAVNDPTIDVVGSLPYFDVQKTVAILVDNGTPDIVDPNDVLRYTITATNLGSRPVTNVVLTDPVPASTQYNANKTTLNGITVTDPAPNVSPLIAGIDISSSDLTPPLPSPGAGILSPGESAVIEFEVTVDAAATAGTEISNQGFVSSNELPDEPTDADGIDSNGDQPTVVVVGEAPSINITKEVFVIGGGTAVAGGELEYVVRVTNTGVMPVTNVVITDDLNDPVAGQMSYIANSGLLNGLSTGVSIAGSTITANYSSIYGNLAPAGIVELRFRVTLDSGLNIGDTVTNKADVRWNVPASTASAEVSIVIGGTPGSATLNGTVWHDANLNKLNDGTERHLEGWSVQLYRNNQLLATVLTDANGVYRLTGLAPNEGTSDFYELRFTAPGADPNTASMGDADSSFTETPFTDGPQRISAITVASGANLQDLNLPLWPNGAVYNSVARQPVAGARLTLLNAITGAVLPSQCFDDPVQQNQITARDGFYKFDLNFSDAACPAGGAYLIEISPPATGYMGMPSQIIPPASDASMAAFSVPDCPGSADDAVPATTDYCEAVASAVVPPESAQPRTAGTVYYMHLLLNNGNVPEGESQIFNNFIPIDPVLDGAVAITKTSSMTNVTRGTLVPYTITVTNVYGSPLYDISIIDRFPAGFKYMANSARLNGNPAEPEINGRELVWDDLELQVNQKYVIQLLLVVGSGVSEGEYVNRAMVLNTATGGAASGEATATVRVIPDPDFDCTDVIGKVFDDGNLNGYQDPGEKGLSGVRVVTVRGLIATTDQHGRFHITCAAVPDEDRGSNFILKLDERSLPTGYRLTTENPRVQRATRGKMIRFNFGATIHRVVRIDIADGVFEPNTIDMRMQWIPKMARLLEELKKAPSVLRLSYLGDVEREGLVQKRLEALKEILTKEWKQSGGDYRLAIETEIFWRRGAPLAGQ